MNGKVAGLSMTSAGTGPGGTMRVHPARRRLAQLRQQRSPVRRRRRAHPQRKHGDHLRHQLRQRRRPGGLRQRRGRPQSGRHRKRLGAERPLGHRPLRIAAANGAIVITTKSGRTDKGWGVTYNGSVSFERAGFWPDFQDEYGVSAVTTSQTNRHVSAWGLPGSMTLDGRPVKQQISRYGLRRKVRRLAKTLSLPLEELGHRGIHAPAVGICRRLVYGYFRNRRDLHQLPCRSRDRREKAPAPDSRSPIRATNGFCPTRLQPPGLCADAEPEAQQAPPTSR